MTEYLRFGLFCHQAVRYSTLLLALIAIAASISYSKSQEKRSVTEPFSFQYFERQPDKDVKSLALSFLNEKFPGGSSLDVLVSELMVAGAKCERGIYRDKHYVRCHWQRPGHGIMALVSTIEWVVVAYTDADYGKIADIVINRGATGP